MAEVYDLGYYIQIVEDGIVKAHQLRKRVWESRRTTFYFQEDAERFWKYFDERGYSVSMNKKNGVYDILIQWC